MTKEQKIEYDRQYHIKHASKINERTRQWHIKNADKVKEKRKQWYIENKIKANERSHSWYIKNVDKVNEYNRQWRARNPEKAKLSHRKSCLKRNYEITIEEYNQLWKLQNGLCSICNLPEKNKINCLVVDHNHTTGKIRGLLCNKCNTGLGMFEENYINIVNASNYINKWK